MRLATLTLLTPVALASCTSDHDSSFGSLPSPSFIVVACSGNPTADGEALRAAIEGATTGTISFESSCTYQVADSSRDGYNTGILIGNKNNLTIEGAGQGVTTVKFERPVYIGFEIRSNTTNLTIRNMTIAGSITQSLCTENPDLDSPQFEPHVTGILRPPARRRMVSPV